jgi:hypothetical protein
MQLESCITATDVLLAGQVAGHLCINLPPAMQQLLIMVAVMASCKPQSVKSWEQRILMPSP